MACEFPSVQQKEAVSPFFSSRFPMTGRETNDLLLLLPSARQLTLPPSLPSSPSIPPPPFHTHLVVLLLAVVTIVVVAAMLLLLLLRVEDGGWRV